MPPHESWRSSLGMAWCAHLLRFSEILTLIKLLAKILTALIVIALLAITVGAYQISRDEPCPSAPAVSAKATMQAVTHLCYGPPETLGYSQTAKPAPEPHEVLIKVHAAGVNPLDWHTMRGSPYLMRLSSGLGEPENAKFGRDFSGVIEAVGQDVTRFKPGDAVFGGGNGAFAEYLVVSQDGAIARLPEDSSHEEGAALTVAGLTALQALRDRGQLKAGQKVLINGASGGVGTFAVQIAKQMGAEVYGVCSTRNVERVLALGADHVFDYKQENYTDSGEQFDLIVDMVGNHSPKTPTKVLAPEGRLVIIGGSKGDWIGPIMGPVLAMLTQPFVDQKLIILLAQLKSEDLETLAGLMNNGTVRPVIDRLYPLSEVASAISYSETGRARGKIILQMIPVTEDGIPSH